MTSSNQAASLDRRRDLTRDELVLTNSEYNVVRPRLKPANLVNNTFRRRLRWNYSRCRMTTPLISFGLALAMNEPWSGKFSTSCRPCLPRRKIPDGHPHRFRDTYVVELLKAGVDIRAVRKALGHSSLPPMVTRFSSADDR